MHHSYEISISTYGSGTWTFSNTFGSKGRLKKQFSLCHPLAVWTATLVFALLSRVSGVKKGYQGQKDAILFPSQTNIVYCCIFDLFFKTPVERRKFMHLSIVSKLTWFVQTKTPRKKGQPTALLQALPAPRVLEKPGPLAAAPPSMAPPSLPGRLLC